jgi:hypothetical protein
MTEPRPERRPLTPADFQYAESIFISRPPEAVYDLVADITRTGEWSPICKACWWDDATGPMPGAWFTGRNESAERVWETRSQVVVADPGREFAWVVGDHWVGWGYRIEPAPGGSTLTESWAVLAAGFDRFDELHGENAATQLAIRRSAALSGIPATLAAIKRIAESEG